MSELIIRHRQGVIKTAALPYFIYINGQLAGYMRGDEIRGSLPAGRYLVEIRLPLRLLRWDVSLSACAQLETDGHETLTLIFRDRERWWDLLFTIDLIFYLFSFFVTIPSPWNVVCHVLSDGFFLVWLVRLWRIRRNYFNIDVRATRFP